MNKINIKNIFVKNVCVSLFLVIYFGLFFSENGFAFKYWSRDYVNIAWNAQKNGIVIKTTVYNYSGPNSSKYGYLEDCQFEASVDGNIYYKLMKINTPRQYNKSKFTQVILTNKLVKADIYFSNSIQYKLMWLDSSKRYKEIDVATHGDLAWIELEWCFNADFRKVSSIRITGKWHLEAKNLSEDIKKYVYYLDKPNRVASKSITTKLNTEVSKNDPVNVFNKSEAIVVKGADSGSTIKVYNQSGVKIKSVVANNEVVNIKLPAKHNYVVHIGKSRYKVTL